MILMGVCMVDGVLFIWGYKELFCIYIEGIVCGGWMFMDVFYEYFVYVWCVGMGLFDDEIFIG